MNYWKIGLGIAVVAGAGWLAWTMTRPVPGIRMADQGREHVTPQAVFEFKYNSNPPTSGEHLPTWVKAGVFEEPQSEGELIHALEHGYVVISYNCNVHLKASLPVIPANAGIQSKNWIPDQVGDDKLISKVFAHEEDGSPSATFNDPTISTGSAVNESDGCKTLVKNLTELANKKKLWKLIIVPRPQLDTTIALTAWTYLDTFDQFDEKRITRFIDYHRDQGPEKTME
ncbi:MAG: DUF3105 domain-containing protein [Patescibacteria group bacterium]